MHTISPPPIACWLLAAPGPTPETKTETWYESLYLDRTEAENTAVEALSWLLRELGCRFVLAQAQDKFDTQVVLVPDTDALAVAVADTAAAMFQLRGDFTFDHAEAFVGVPAVFLMQPIPVPEGVLTPAVAAHGHYGHVTKRGQAWYWEQTIDNEAVLAGAEPRQGLVWAWSDSEAISRLREHFPDAGGIRWIKPHEYAQPFGLEMAD
jgi:hypothetical protein